MPRLKCLSKVFNWGNNYEDEPGIIAIEVWPFLSLFFTLSAAGDKATWENFKCPKISTLPRKLFCSDYSHNIHCSHRQEHRLQL